jgi:hypothetical protein
MLHVAASESLSWNQYIKASGLSPELRSSSLCHWPWLVANGSKFVVCAYTGPYGVVFRGVTFGRLQPADPAGAWAESQQQ